MAASDAPRIQVNGGDTKSRVVQNGSAFHRYPPSRPFINDDYTRDVTKPIIAYPESNRQGMIHFSCAVAFSEITIFANHVRIWLFFTILSYWLVFLG